MPHFDYSIAAYYVIATAEASSNLARYDGCHYGYRSPNARDYIEVYSKCRAEGFGAEVKRRIMLGTFALSSGYYDAYYLKALKVRNLIRQDFTNAFAKADCLMMPVAPSTAFKIGEKTSDPLQMYLADVYTIAVNLAGVPGISIPCGFDENRLPIGLQIIGPAFSEDKLLRIGRMFESKTDYHRQKPMLQEIEVMAAKLDYKVIVGLEIHVHLATKTKMFCGCELAYGGAPNSRVCPVCMGMPGSLPVMNKQAYEFSVLTAMALNCQIARFTKWDRKSYYYPDMPKNYQISQYDLPLSHDGFIEIPLEDGTIKRVGIIRAHLEEDAGKNTHELGNFSAVDLNRAGSPLLEIVTAPDMNSAAEVRQMAQELQRIVRYLGVSEADMQKGHMRFEPNVNLHIYKDGQTYKTPISEIKNLNSFRAIERSVTYEIQRQLDEFLETGKTMQMGNKSTYGWDDVNQTTVLQREKEEAHDYRYFPEPDLVPVELDDAWLEQIKAQVGRIAVSKTAAVCEQYGLSDYDAAVLTADKATAEYFDAVVRPERIPSGHAT